jgi:predicted RNA-binding protein associated with RNAse of E/G family
MSALTMLRNRLPRPVTIRYRRLSDGIRDFHGVLREVTRDRWVVEHRIKIRNPIRELGKIAVATNYLAIRFILRSKWYDVCKFYDRNLRFVGYYCNIVKPVSKLLIRPNLSTIITDLYIDLWITPEGRHVVHDEDELGLAVRRNVLSDSLARQARKHMNSLIRLTLKERFPPVSIRKVKPMGYAQVESLKLKASRTKMLKNC